MKAHRSLSAIRRLAVALAAGVACAPAPGCSAKYEPLHSKSLARTWTLGGVAMNLEVAHDSASRARGLMFRKSLPADHGMLFVYPTPRVLRFWMRNTAIPLSIAFVEETADGKGRIANIEEMQPFVETGTVSLAAVRLAIEMPSGWFAQHQVKAGDVIELPSWLTDVVPGEDNQGE